MAEDSHTRDHADFGDSNSESSDSESLSKQVRKLLEKNNLLTSKSICRLLNLDYKVHGSYINNIKSSWRSNFQNRHALKCLSFHKAYGWIYALKSVDRSSSVKVGWLETRAKNKMLVWKDAFGRLEWHVSGRIVIRVKKPATKGRVKQLLANAFFNTGLIQGIQAFDVWANSANFKRAHAVLDTGERLPYAKIDFLKDSLDVVVKTGDVSHPTAIEIEFCYPDWAERNELLFTQMTKFLRDLSEPRKPSRDQSRMVV